MYLLSIDWQRHWCGWAELHTHWRIWLIFWTWLHGYLGIQLADRGGRAQGEQRITHGYFYGPSPEVAHITSAHILLALFSREMEKWGLAVSTRRAGYESGCIHAYWWSNMKSFVGTGWTPHSRSPSNKLLKIELLLRVSQREPLTSWLWLCVISALPSAWTVTDDKRSTNGHQREQSHPCSNNPQLSGCISNSSSSDPNVSWNLISLNQTKLQRT